MNTRSAAPSTQQRAASWGCAGALLLILPGAFGIAAAVTVIVVLPHVLARLEPRSAREERERCERDLPIAVDLLAAALSSGSTPARAARLVGDAVEGPLGRRLTAVAVQLDLGAEPRRAWTRLGEGRPFSRAADALARSAITGGTSTRALERLAAELRGSARRQAEARARRVTVRIAAPLGLCFLPAFVLLAIVPAVVGALGATLR